MDEERSFVKPKAVLKRGQSFGELAIINGSKRRSTVVAMEETEMLSLWYEVRLRWLVLRIFGLRVAPSRAMIPTLCYPKQLQAWSNNQSSRAPAVGM